MAKHRWCRRTWFREEGGAVTRYAFSCEECGEPTNFGRYKIVRWHGRYHSIYLCDNCHNIEGRQHRLDALWDRAKNINTRSANTNPTPPDPSPPSGGGGVNSEGGVSFNDLRLGIRVLDTYLTSLEQYVDNIDERLSRLEFETSGPSKPAATKDEPLTGGAGANPVSERGQPGAGGERQCPIHWTPVDGCEWCPPPAEHPEEVDE